jgi:hypothetical protein
VSAAAHAVAPAPEAAEDADAAGLLVPLTLRASFLLPLRSPLARREIAIGALLLLVPFVGWLLNMGHRIRMVHRMLHGRPAWPAWNGWGGLLRDGAVTFGGMVYYALPGLAAAYAGWRTGSAWLLGAGAALLALAVAAIPGYMTYYCVALDPREIYDPFRALRRVLRGGRLYWRAWGIALAALAVSFLGLLGFGVGFLFTSVWFWQVAGFAFARAFYQTQLRPE